MQAVCLGLRLRPGALLLPLHPSFVGVTRYSVHQTTADNRTVYQQELKRSGTEYGCVGLGGKREQCRLEDLGEVSLRRVGRAGLPRTSGISLGKVEGVDQEQGRA